MYVFAYLRLPFWRPPQHAFSASVLTLNVGGFSLQLTSLMTLCLSLQLPPSLHVWPPCLLAPLPADRATPKCVLHAQTHFPSHLLLMLCSSFLTLPLLTFPASPRTSAALGEPFRACPVPHAGFTPAQVGLCHQTLTLEPDARHTDTHAYLLWLAATDLSMIPHTNCMCAINAYLFCIIYFSYSPVCNHRIMIK